MDNLDDHCLWMIFAFLPIVDRIRTEGVCRRWRNVSQNSWNTLKKLDFKSETWTSKYSLDIIVIEQSTFEKVIRLAGRYLRSIDFSQSSEKGVRHNLNMKAIKNALMSCPKLEEVQLFHIQSIRCGGRISSTCTKAEHKITPCLIEYKDKITKLGLDVTCLCDNRKDITEFFGSLKKLKSLHLSNFHQIIYNKCLLECLPFSSIEEITFSKTKTYIYNTNLPYLAIPRFQNLKSIGVTNFVDFQDSLVEVLHPRTSVKSLNLKASRITDPDGRFLKYASQLVQLEELDVEAAFELVDDKFLKTITAVCKNIRKLNISSCNKLTDAGISTISSLQELRSLSVNSLEEITFLPPENMQHLQKLDCSFCINLGHTSLCAVVRKAPNLQKLFVQNCNINKQDFLDFLVNVVKIRDHCKFLNVQVEILEKHVITKTGVIHLT